MAGKRKFRAQPLQVVCTDEMREVIDTIAEGEDISVAAVVRESLDGQGLAARFELFEQRRREGKLPSQKGEK
jgi:hypothetical protein